MAGVAASRRGSAAPTLSIEAPAAGMLSSRSVYELESPVMASLSPEEAAALRADYEASDVDRIHAARRPS